MKNNNKQHNTSAKGNISPKDYILMNIASNTADNCNQEQQDDMANFLLGF